MHRLAMLVRALVSFARVEWGLRRGTLPQLCDRLGVRLESGPTGSVPVQPAWPATVPRWQVVQVVTLVGRLTRRWPFGDTCLRRCLVTGHLLARIGTPVTVVIGVRRVDGVVQAHSWLEIGGMSLDASSAEWERMTRA